MSRDPTPGSPADQAIWLERARRAASSPDEGIRGEHAPKRRRRPVTFLSSYGTVFQSPTDMERAARQPRVAGLFEQATPPDDWLAANEQRITVYDGHGRSMRIPEADWPEYERDGWCR